MNTFGYKNQVKANSVDCFNMKIVSSFVSMFLFLFSQFLSFYSISLEKNDFCRLLPVNTNEKFRISGKENEKSTKRKENKR